MRHEQESTQVGTENKYGYNGKELNDDFQLDLHDYGARWYDASIAQFTTQDRFSEKYYDSSPYQYVGGNPINRIDINGDSILVTVNTAHPTTGKLVQTDYYWTNQPGSGGWDFRNETGNIYTGNDVFLGQVKSALNALINGGSTGASLVADVANAFEITEIQRRNVNGADFVAGKFIAFNPTSTNGSIDVNGNVTRSPFVVLGHELAHVKDIRDGTINRNTWFTTLNGQAIPNAEIYATHVENKIRAENNIPLRAYYAKTTSGHGAGPKLLIGNTQSAFYNNLEQTTYSRLSRRNVRSGVVTPYTY